MMLRIQKRLITKCTCFLKVYSADAKELNVYLTLFDGTNTERREITLRFSAEWPLVIRESLLKTKLVLYLERK